MIIGINGYIGSGKDTVGKIIQYLTFDWRNNFMNEIPSFEQFMKHEYQGGYKVGYNMLIPPTWTVVKFAGKLKQIASLMTGIPVEKFEDQEFKQTFLGPEWSSLIERGEDEAADYHMMTVREFLQKLGTEAVREGLHTNAWVNALFADYKPPKMSERNPSNWVITDTRFPNEAQAIKDRGGIVVRVNRDEFIDGYPLTQGIPKHPSETGLDNWNFDYVLENNGSIDDLIPKVKEMLEHFKI